MRTVTVFSRNGMIKEEPRSGVVVISIRTPGDPLDLPGWEKVFPFEFDDVSELEELATGGRKAIIFTNEMARQIIGITREYRDWDFICHCDAGVSRSVAVARFIAEEYGHRLVLLGNVYSDQNANGHVLRLLHRQLWF